MKITIQNLKENVSKVVLDEKCVPCKFGKNDKPQTWKTEKIQYSSIEHFSTAILKEIIEISWKCEMTNITEYEAEVEIDCFFMYFIST